jgi:hypothetical protein
MTFVIRSLYSAICPLSSVFCPLSSVLRYKKGRALLLGPAFFAFLHRRVKLTDADLVCTLHGIPERNRNLEYAVFIFG